MEPVKQRKPRRIFDRRSVFFAVVTLILFAAVFYMLNSINQSVGGKKSTGSDSAQLYRDLGNKLKSEKMYDQAIAAYERYLSATNANNQTKSNIFYLIGDLHFEQHRYEQALSAYYTADMMGPSELVRNDLNIKIVNCLERLGRDFSAEYALKSRTALDQPEKKDKPEGKIVAQYGDNVVTMRDLDEQLEKLPEEQRKEFRDPQKKFQFLNQYLATELLARKATKMGYDRDADVNDQLEMVKKQLMIQKMVDAQFKDKISVTPEDVKLYYDANKAKYTDPAAVKLAVIKTDAQEKADTLLTQINSGTDFNQLAISDSLDATKAKGGVIDAWLSLDNPVGEGSDRTPVISAALDLDKGAVSDVIPDGQGGFYIAKVLDKKPAQQKAFNDVMQQAAQDYQMFKGQRLYQEMMQDILKVEGVQINYQEFFPEQDTQQQNQKPKVDIKPINQFGQ